jgi:hypothetical protein
VADRPLDLGLRRGRVRASARDRLAAWVVTGPVGRVIAFVWDLGAAWLQWATSKVRRR